MTTYTSRTEQSKTFVLANHVLALDINREGKIIRRPVRKLRTGESRLENTLLSALYPNIKVATVNIPRQMEMHEEVRVHETLADFVYQGVQYVLVGASGSAKDGKFYFVDRESAKELARRFHNWPEAAMVYFGMLVSRCEEMIKKTDIRVLIVPDGALGTRQGCEVSEEVIRQLIMTLADDGYLTVLGGTIYCGSDWVPTGGAIMAGEADRALVVRYPIRMFEDLLPLGNLSDLRLRNLLAERFQSN